MSTHDLVEREIFEGAKGGAEELATPWRKFWEGSWPDIFQLQLVDPERKGRWTPRGGEGRGEERGENFRVGSIRVDGGRRWDAERHGGPGV